MTQINFDLTEAITKAKKKAELDLVSGVQNAGQGIVRSLLNDGRYKAFGPEGLAHEIIRKKIEDYVLSDAFALNIGKTIERVMDEESEKALRALLNSKARKHLFQPTSPVEEERFTGNPTVPLTVIKNYDDMAYYKFPDGSEFIVYGKIDVSIRPQIVIGSGPYSCRLEVDDLDGVTPSFAGKRVRVHVKVTGPQHVKIIDINFLGE